MFELVEWYFKDSVSKYVPTYLYDKRFHNMLTEYLNEIMDDGAGMVGTSHKCCLTFSMFLKE